MLPSLRVGGAEKKVISLLQHIDRSRFLPSLIVQTADGPLWQQLPSDVRFVDLDKSQMRFVVPSLAGVLREINPDLVFSPMEHTCVAVALARRVARMNMPLVFSVESNIRRSLREIPARTRWVYRSVYKRFYPQATCVVAVSQGVADLFTKEIPQVKNRIVILPNPVVPERTNEEEAEPVDPWLESSIPVFLACGRLVKAKGFDTLIRAFADLRQRRNARLLIVGEGPQRRYLEALIRECHLRGSVRLPGYTSSPWRWMEKASAFVLSSRWEGMPGVLIEAMSCGVPCVASDCDFGPRELIEHGRNGLLARADDAHSLAVQMERILNENALAQELGRAAKNSVVRFTEKAACVAHEELFASLLGQQRAEGVSA
jgi:glycosyltransferase involved in cell wall biosynthesis